MSNPNNINQTLRRAVATQQARIPSIPAINVPDPATASALRAIKEYIEVREGSRGNPFEKTVTMRELDELGLVRTGPASGGEASLAGLVCQTKAGEYVLVTLDQLIAAMSAKTNLVSGTQAAVANPLY